MIENKIEIIEKIETLPHISNSLSVRIRLKLRLLRERYKTLCTSEVIELVKEKYHFQVLKTLQIATISNIIEDNREGVWTFEGYYDVEEKEKWLFENPEAINSVFKGLKQANKNEFVSSPEEEVINMIHEDSVHINKEKLIASFPLNISKKEKKEKSKKLVEKKEE